MTGGHAFDQRSNVQVQTGLGAMHRAIDRAVSLDDQASVPVGKLAPCWSLPEAERDEVSFTRNEFVPVTSIVVRAGVAGAVAESLQAARPRSSGAIARREIDERRGMAREVKRGT